MMYGAMPLRGSAASVVSDRPPTTVLGACQCSFCRKQMPVRSLVQGQVDLTATDREQLQLYTSAWKHRSRSSGRVACSVAMIFVDSDRSRSIINIDTLTIGPCFHVPEAP